MAIGAVLVLAIAVSCTRGAGLGSVGGDLTGVKWSVTSISGTAAPPGFYATATFKDGHVAGVDGCNWYGRDYLSTIDGAFRLGEGSMTAMGCLGAAGRLVDRFQSALGKVTAYRVQGDVLTLFDKSGDPVLVFRGGAPPPISGMTWQVYGFRQGPPDDKLAVEGPGRGGPITATFEDGRITGATACGRYGADFTATATTAHAGPIDLQRPSCNGAARRMVRAYFSALRTTESWQFYGPSFQLLNSSRTISANLDPA